MQRSQLLPLAAPLTPPLFVAGNGAGGILSCVMGATNPAAISSGGANRFPVWPGSSADLLPRPIRQGASFRAEQGMAVLSLWRGEDKKMVPLSFLPTDLVDFWLMPWSEPLRSACCWIALLGAPLHGKKPDKDAARWLRPLFLQRWVGQAVAERMAWLRAHPEANGDRFGDESDPGWREDGWTPPERPRLRRMEEAEVLRLIAVELERLTRIAEEAPALVGGGPWTEAALTACPEMARLYAELRHRHRAGRARELQRAGAAEAIGYSAEVASPV